MCKPYLYIFGFEDPIDRETNESVGTDFESSRLILISASTEAEALAWGHEISERFVAYLYGDSSVSWKESNFASWIDHRPDRTLAEAMCQAPHVVVGEYPDFNELGFGLHKIRGLPNDHEL